MRIYKRLKVLIFCTLIVSTATILHAQDDNSDDGYAIALARIQEARESNTSELDLRFLGLTDIPPEISNLTNLRGLFLGDNQLTSLPSEIGDMTHIERLNLFNNQLSEFPPEIGNLTNLLTLSLGDNLMTNLPKDIGNLINLQVLDLSGNQLSDLPSDIGNLANLHWLNLHGNQLTDLPSEINNLSNLQTLILNNNQLTNITLKVRQLPNLQELYLHNNPLVFPPQEIIDQGTPAILDFLRHPQPYPPFQVGWAMLGTLATFVLTTVLMGYGYLRYLRRWGRKL